MLKKRLCLVLLAAGLVNISYIHAATNVYRQSETGHVQSVTYGTIQHVRQVKIEQDNQSGYFASATSAGSVGGALAGGLAGSRFGKGNGRRVMTAVGAIAGGIAGQQLQKRINTIDGQELEILQDNGETVVVVQPGVQFSFGQRVAITGDYGRVTVSRR